MRLGLYGGSFDPVHYGHLLLAECCREQCSLDQVWFLPAANPPHKKGDSLSPAVHRTAMLRLATIGHEAFDVNAQEIDRGGTSYTVDTLRHFHQTCPDDELFLLLGADMMADLPNWREPEEICRLALVVAVDRPGSEPLDLTCLESVASAERIEQMRSHRVEMPPIGISSTELRHRVKTGRSIRFQTPRPVEEYIRTNKLYE